MPLISVIIPVYNSEKYLRECLESVVNQSFKDFEVLLINDGSTDNSGRICDEYAAKDNRFKVFHKENGGVSSARNLGLENAKGEWIAFVDSDDWIGKEYFKALINVEENVDLLLLNMKRSSSNEIKSKINFETFLLKKNEFLEKYTVHPHFFGPCGKFYKSKVVRNNNISFDKKLSFGEDSLFNLKFIRKAITFKSFNSWYYYRDTPKSLSKVKYILDDDKYFFYEIKNELIKFNNKSIYIRNIIYPINRYFLSIYKSEKKESINSKEELKNLLSSDEEALLYLYRNSKFNLFILKFCIEFKLYALLNFYFKKRFK